MARSVVVCPNDPNDIAKATEKLGCGKDRYGNSQYVCAPNQQKTELKEFCLQGTMEMIEGGIFKIYVVRILYRKYFILQYQISS